MASSPQLRSATPAVRRFAVLAPLLLSLGVFFFALPAEATCPLCFITAGAGLFLARTFGLGMTVVGATSGAISVVFALWMHYATKRYRFPYRPVALSFLFVLLNNVLLTYPGSLASFDAFLSLGFFATVSAWGWFGGVLLFVALMLSKAQKRVAGRTLIPYQSVLVTVGALVGAGIIAAIADTYL